MDSLGRKVADHTTPATKEKPSEQNSEGFSIYELYIKKDVKKI